MGRKLKSRSTEFLGVDQKVWLGLETGGYGELATGGLVPADSGAIDFNSCSITFDIPREDASSRSGRSVVARLSGKKTVEVKVESHIIPADPDALGNPQLPPMHPLLVTAFGEVDLTDPTKIAYRLGRFNGNSARILEETSHSARLVEGVIANNVSFTLPGDGKAMMSFEGFAQDAYIAGETKLAQNVTGAEQLASLVAQDLTITSVAALGKAANLINLTYVAGGTAGAEVVTVVGNDISIAIADGASTATQIEAAINASAAALALITVAISGVGANAQVAAVQAFLAGGLGAFDILVTSDQGIRVEAGSYLDVLLAADGDTMLLQSRKVVAVAAPPTQGYDGQNKDIITLDSTGGALPALTTGDYVIGHAPESYLPITSEKALLGLKGTFSIGGGNIAGECDLISAEISVNNNYTKKDFNYGKAKSCGFIPDKRREVSVKLDILLTKETFSFYMRNKQFLAEDVVITLEPQDIPGPSYASGQGRTFKFSLPKVEFNIPTIENPADGYVTLSLEGKALAPSANQLDEEFVLEII